MALKQGSARESAKKKSGGQPSRNKVPLDRRSSRVGAPVDREPRATANRDMGRSGEKETGGANPSRGKRLLSARPAAGKEEKWAKHVRRGEDVSLPPGEDTE